MSLPADITDTLNSWSKQSLSVGFCLGAFDIITAETLEFLHSSAAHFDRLLVAVIADPGYRTRNGSYAAGSLLPENERCELVKRLPEVDCAFVTDHENLIDLLAQVKPAGFFSWNDHIGEETPETIRTQVSGCITIQATPENIRAESIITRIESQYGMRAATCLPGPELQKQPAVFLDRDGTLIQHVTHLHEPEKVKFFPEGLACLKRLQDAGFRLVIVTNQAGIGLGYFTREDFYAVNLVILKEATRVGVLFDKLYFSPYNKRDQTKCRKPGRGMIDRAVVDLNIDLSQSYVIGDTTTDMQLAKNTGCTGILVATGSGGRDGIYEVSEDFKATGLNEAVEFILRDSAGQHVG